MYSLIITFSLHEHMVWNLLYVMNSTESSQTLIARSKSYTVCKDRLFGLKIVILGMTKSGYKEWDDVKLHSKYDGLVAQLWLFVESVSSNQQSALILSALLTACLCSIIKSIMISSCCTQRKSRQQNSS